MTQLEKLKELLRITDDDNKDFVLETTIRRVEDIIKNYCNLEQVPAALEGTVLSMAMEMYRMETSGIVQSISVGDTSTTFATQSDRERQLVNDFKGQIDPFRRVRW